MTYRAWASRVIGLLLVATGRGWGQSVTLQIKPHLGDTLRIGRNILRVEAND